jgi:hypothetical protein
MPRSCVRWMVCKPVMRLDHNIIQLALKMRIAMTIVEYNEVPQRSVLDSQVPASDKSWMGHFFENDVANNGSSNRILVSADDLIGKEVNLPTIKSEVKCRGGVYKETGNLRRFGIMCYMDYSLSTDLAHPFGSLEWVVIAHSTPQLGAWVRIDDSLLAPHSID